MHHPKYWIDVVEPKKTDILYRNIDENQRIRLESYRRTSGVMNYVRLINGAFSTKPISEWEEPDHIPWQAIMGRDGNIYETYDEFMEAEGNPDWPSIAVYSIATNGLWGIFITNRPCLKRFINISTIRLFFMGNTVRILA